MQDEVRDFYWSFNKILKKKLKSLLINVHAKEYHASSEKIK